MTGFLDISRSTTVLVLYLSNDSTHYYHLFNKRIMRIVAITSKNMVKIQPRIIPIIAPMLRPPTCIGWELHELTELVPDDE